MNVADLFPGLMKGRTYQNNYGIPPSVNHDNLNAPVPPTYVLTLRAKARPLANLVYSGYPASNQLNARWIKNTPEILGVSAWHDSPDPVRQSNFVAEGNKIHPFGGDITPLHTALWKALIMRDAYQVGKIQNFWRPQMYAGTQNPSIRRINITPGQATTFGSQYTVSGSAAPQRVTLASGLSFGSMDGDPYS